MTAKDEEGLEEEEPEEVPADIGALFKKFKDQDIKPKERTKLLHWIIEMMKEKDFSLRSLTMTGYGYTRTDHDRLQRAVNRLQKTLSITATSKMKELESDSFSKFIEETWEEAKNIATDTVMTWRTKAIEYGFFDKENQKVKMKDFIETACDFYVKNVEALEGIEERIRDIEAIAALFAELSKPNVLRIIALRSYMEFVNHITRLAAMGIPVPDSVIIDVKNEVEKVMLSTYKVEKEVQNWQR